METSLLNAVMKTVLVCLIPTVSFAEPTQEWRCNIDSLDSETAMARVEWARRCGLLKNLSPLGADNTITSSKAFDQNMTWAKDYKEFNSSMAYTGNLNQYNVNYYFAFALFDATPQYSVFREPSGRPTSGYWKWSHWSPRVRALYPSFESSQVAGGGMQLFPHPTLANCNLYKDKTGTTQWTSNFFVIAYCESACYAPDQRLLYGDGEANIVEAMTQRREDVMTLSPDATLDNLKLQQGKVYSYTTETRDSEHTLYTFTTASGGRLRVTHEHPIITSEGRLVQAQSLVEGQELLRVDGTPDRIVSVVKSTHFGKVYNLKPDSRDPVSNILVAEGFLVGSGRFQNDDVKYMNRVLLFRGVPDAVLPQ